MAKSGPTQLPDELWEKALKILVFEIRVRETMSQAELADRLQVSGPTVSGWFNGKRPTKYNLERALRALGRDPAELFGQDASAEPWEAAARAAGHDPADPTVKRIYSGAFDRAMAGAAETIEAINATQEPAETGEFPTKKPKIRSG